MLSGKLRHRRQGGDGHCHKEFHVWVVDKVRHRRQHGGESPASCGTGEEHDTMSVSWQLIRGEGMGGVPLIEANGDGNNRGNKMALVAICVLQR